MMHLKSDTATCAEADWSFTEDPALMARLAAQAQRYAAAYGIDPDDAEQEVYLWLAVRPKLQRLAIGMVLDNTRQRLMQLVNRAKGRMEVLFDDELDHEAA